MKRLLQLITFLTLLFFAGSAMAAWTCTEGRKVYGPDKSKVIIIVTCAGDGSGATYDLDTYLSDVIGYHLWTLYVIPGTGGTAPDAAFDIDIEDSNDFHLLDTDANSHTTQTWNVGSDTLGQYPLIKDAVSIVFADIGTAADTVVVELHFVK